jgi:transcription elongation GreA/GreB family factor
MWDQVVKLIIAEIQAKIQEMDAHVESAVDAAIHAQSSMESRYDGYKAEFSRTAAAIDNFRNNYATALLEIQTLIKKGMTKSETVTIGCIVRLRYQNGNERLCFLISEAAGGMEVDTPFGTVILVSTFSPLGEQLLGKKLGAIFSLGPHNIVIAEIQRKE